MQIVFYILMAFWLLSEIFYKNKLKSNQTKENSKDKNSLSILWWSIGLSIFLSTFLINVKEINQFTISANPMVSIFAFSIIFIGILGRVLVIKSLGKFFTVDVAISEEQK